MTESILVTSARTEDLNANTSASIVQLCITAFQEEELRRLFSCDANVAQIAGFAPGSMRKLGNLRYIKIPEQVQESAARAGLLDLSRHLHPRLCGPPHGCLMGEFA